MTGLAQPRVNRMLALLAGLGLAASACGGAATTAPTAPPTEPAEGDCANMPTTPITLTYWEASGENLSEEGVATLDAEFEDAHPSVDVSRVAKTFPEIMASARRQAAGPDPPDILLTNAYDLLGPLVAADLVLPLDVYASRFGWSARFGDSALRVQRFASDGTQYGAGSLYGVAPTAAYVGLFYNRNVMTQLGLQVPATYEELLETLEAAKQADVVPIAFGTRERWPAMDMLASLYNVTAPIGQIREFVYRTSADATFDTPESREAAGLAQDLGRKGYFSPGFRDKSQQSAIDDFVAGKALYLLQSTAFAGSIRDGLGDTAGIVLFPGRQGGPFAATGAPGFGWSISSRSKHPDAAACYLDWRTGRRAAEMLVAEGGLPAMILEPTGDSPLTDSIIHGWSEIARRDALVPYLAWAATGLHDTLSAATARLVGDELSPAEFTTQVQRAYERLKPGD